LRLRRADQREPVERRPDRTPHATPCAVPPMITS
jgi:hypothetical protein